MSRALSQSPGAIRQRLFRERNRAAGLCAKCTLPAVKWGLCEGHHIEDAERKETLKHATREVGGGQIHAEWERVGEVAWNQVRERLGELAYVPSDNVIEDNRRRAEAGLPIVKRGRWGR